MLKSSSKSLMSEDLFYWMKKGEGGAGEGGAIG